MRKGQVVRGYRITTSPTNDNAGKCVWAFAERDGHQYFIKEFIELKRPAPGSMGTPEDKRIQLEACEKFERRHRSVIEKIDPRDLDAGNLVVAVDFFYEGTKYYKLTERLDHDAEVQPYDLTPDQKSVLLGTLADSLALLHRLGVVHGDLKPQNVLLYRPDGSDLYTAKLIDFDDAYLSGNPPERGLIAGDALYGAPEFVRYMKGDPRTAPDQLTTAADMFAFGLLLHTYITGSLPGYDGKFSSPAECVNAGQALQLDGRLDLRIRSMLSALTARDPRARPMVGGTLTLLEQSSALILREVPEEDLSSVSASRVRINRGGSGGNVRPRFGDPDASGVRPPPDVGPPSDSRSQSMPPTRRSRVRIHIDPRRHT